MTLREGNLEAPTRHPIDWKGADYYDEAKTLRRDGAGVRHLPWLPPLRQPVPVVPEPVRPGRRHRRRRGARRRQEGLRQGRRPVLPVRPLLHDQVPVRAAAPVAGRLPAPDAARQGDQVQEGRGRRRREAARRDRRARPVRRHPDRHPGGQRRQPDPAGAQDPRRRARRPSRRLAAGARDAALPLAPRRSRTARRRSSTASAARARSRSSRPASSTTTSPASATTCCGCSRTTRFPTRSSRRRAAAACPSSSSATSKAWPGTRTPTSRCSPATPGGLGDRLGGPVVHPDVQAGAAADVPRRRRREGGPGGDVRPVRVPRRAPSRRPAEDRLQDAARQGELPHPVPRTGAEDRPQDRGDAQADRQDRRGRAQRPSSAAPAMPAPTA